MEKKLLGRWGEEQAARYLEKKKFRIIGINYTCRFGEIDIIAENRRYVVFVEVKLRKSDRFAAAREFVTTAKRERLIATAQLWLQANAGDKQPRFDVVEVYAPEGMEGPIHINHIENAFEVNT